MYLIVIVSLGLESVELLKRVGVSLGGCYVHVYCFMLGLVLHALILIMCLELHA